MHSRIISIRNDNINMANLVDQRNALKKLQREIIWASTKKTDRLRISESRSTNKYATNANINSMSDSVCVRVSSQTSATNHQNNDQCAFDFPRCHTVMDGKADRRASPLLLLLLLKQHQQRNHHIQPNPIRLIHLTEPNKTNFMQRVQKY